MRRTLALAAAALFAGACAPDGPSDGDASEARGAIVGGSVDEGDPAVMMLVSYAPDHSVFDTCTASVIAKDVLITAAHCLDPATHPDCGFGVFAGADASAFPTANTLIPKLLPVKEVHMHPDYDPSPPFTADIGVVLLQAPVDVAPLPVQRDPIDASIAGEPARIVGYGQIQYKEYNAVRHAAETSVAAFDEGDTLTVGDKDHRSCVGDSGGPALAEIDGAERIVGVDSYTDLAGCLDPAHYRRPDVYIPFLDTYAPPPATGGTGGGGTGGAGGGSTGGGGAGGDSSAPESGCACSLAGDGGGDTPMLVGLFTLLAASLAVRSPLRAARTRSSRPWRAPPGRAS